MNAARLAIRSLCSAPAVSAVAILSFALGVGANTAVFSLLNAVLLKPLPYPDPDRLVLLGYTFSGASVPLVSETKLNVWREHTSVLQNQARLAGEAFHRRFPQASGPADTFTVTPLHRAMVEDARASLLVLAGAVAFVLLIACANIAILMLIRGSVRWREIAIRAALGATRWQIVRPFMIECLLLAIVGGGLGLVLATAGMRAVLAVNSVALPRLDTGAGHALIDWRVLLFATVVSVWCAASDQRFACREPSAWRRSEMASVQVRTSATVAFARYWRLVKWRSRSC